MKKVVSVDLLITMKNSFDPLFQLSFPSLELSYVTNINWLSVRLWLSVYAFPAKIKFATSAGCNISQNTYWVLLLHGVLRGTHVTIPVSTSQHGLFAIGRPEIDSNYCPKYLGFPSQCSSQHPLQSGKNIEFSAC